MKREEAKAITHALSSAIANAIEKYVDAHPGSGNRQPQKVVASLPTGTSPTSLLAQLRDPDTLDFLFREFRNRLIDSLNVDPVFVKLLAHVPELEIEITPRVIQLDDANTRGRAGLLIVRGWFDTPKTVGGTRKELARTGTDPGGGGALYDILKNFVRDGLLTIEGDGYVKAPGLKCSERRIET